MIKQIKDFVHLILQLSCTVVPSKHFLVSFRHLFQPGENVVLNLFKPFLPNKNQRENFKNNEYKKNSNCFHSMFSDDKN